MGKRNGRDRSHEEASRYFKNALDLLKRAPRKNGLYADLKPVREACGTAWLAVLEAADAALVSRGVLHGQLPQSYEEYLKAIQRHLAVKNGRLLSYFKAAYFELHVAGHYRGLLAHPEAVNAAFSLGRTVIEKLSGRKIG